jgi:PAS domain S-box-containing protein
MGNGDWLWASMDAAVSAGVVVHDVNGRIIACNDSATRILGLTAGQMAGVTSIDPGWRAIHEDGTPIPFEALRGMLTLRNGEPQAGVVLGVYKPDGELTWISMDSRAVLREGRPQAVVATFMEVTEHIAEAKRAQSRLRESITERKLAEAELRQSEERFRSLYENTTMGLYRTTPEGRILLANPCLVNMLGYDSLEELAQRDLSEAGFEPTYDRDGFKRRMEAEGVVKGLEALWKKKDGTFIFVRESAKAIRDAEGRIVHYEGTVEDITERKQSEARLDRVKKIVRMALRVGKAGAWELDLKTGELFWTPEYYELLGVAPGFRPTVESFLALVHPEDRDLVRASLHRSAREGSPFHDQFRMSLSDGIHWMERRGVVLRDAADKPERIIAITADITERKNAETERESLQGQLLQAQKMEAIGQLAGGVAHDFNNLLMVIRSYSELLQQELVSERQRGRVQQILNACERASDTTRQLLAFSRRQTIAPRLLDLNGVVRNLWKMLPRLIGEHIALEQQLADNLKFCKADPTHIEQLVLNLVLNARDALPGGGKLRVETANVYLERTQDGTPARVAPGWYSMLAVADDGIGMDPATKARVFEPFFTTKGIGKGTGLGLSTVYGIVEQNGGSIMVESEPGRGSTFKVYLPSVEDVMVEPGGVLQEPVAVVRGSATILLVDDEAALRDAGAEFLRSYGYRVMVAANGEEALQFARSPEQIDVLVTDIVMPGRSGRELAEQCRALRPDIRVLYMSGYSGTAGIPDVLLTESYVQKPFSFAQLARRIEESMGEPRSAVGLT